MYNRYIPQPDGSYRKSRMQEPHHQDVPKYQSAPKQEHFSPPPPPPPQKVSHKQRQDRPVRTRREPDSISGFFKNLLPKDLDTGDLMIILLLLLMAGDCEDDKNTALLTLALYFFM